MSTKFTNLDANLRRLITEIEKNPQDIYLRGAKEAQGILTSRIFNDNKTKSGQSFGQYKSKSWKKKRREANRQIGHKDLQFTGDATSGLMGSIKAVRKGKKNAVVEFTDNDMIPIADGQEGQIGKGPIFELSDNELKQVLKEIMRDFRIMLNKAIKKSFK